MRNPLYLRQLKKDLAHWVSEGIVQADNADFMLETAGYNAEERSLPTIIAVLGALLIGFAALSYVAANFWAIPRVFLLGALIGFMWVTYFTGAMLLLRLKPGLGQAAIFLGVILFGVNLMLIAQMYHISAHYPDGVMVWALSALAAAIIVPSRIALGTAFALAALWTSLESFQFDIQFHWPFLIFWAIGFLLTHILKWRAGFHLGVLTLLYWLSLSTIDLAAALSWSETQVISLYAVFWLLVWSLSCSLEALAYPFSTALERYGALLFLMTLFVLQLFYDTPPENTETTWLVLLLCLSLFSVIFSLLNFRNSNIRFIDVIAISASSLAVLAFPIVSQQNALLIQWLYSTFIILAAVWFVSFGALRGDNVVINASIVAFGAEALYIYFETFDSLLSQSTFFAAGGLLLIITSVVLARLQRSIIGQDLEEERGEEP